MRTPRTYETTLTLPSGAEIVVEGRPGRDPLERDAWELLATTTDEAHPVHIDIDADEEDLARAALVEQWCEAQRNAGSDDSAACAREEAWSARRELRAEVA